MASLNKVMLIGNAGRDAELRYLANGTAVANFTLAVNSRRRGQSGDWEDQTEWFNISVWREQAERVSQYITKGKQLFVEGRLQTRNWDDDQGVRHYRTEVIASNIVLLGSRGGDGGGGRGGDDWNSGDDWGGGGSRGRSGYSGPRDSAGGIEPDDLPFE